VRLTKTLYDALREEMRTVLTGRVRGRDPLKVHKQQMRICRLDMAYMRQKDWTEEWDDYTADEMLRVMEILDSVQKQNK
jgi:hypothetical protein